MKILKFVQTRAAINRLPKRMKNGRYIAMLLRGKRFWKFKIFLEDKNINFFMVLYGFKKLKLTEKI